jgi:hypothetical protein
MRSTLNRIPYELQYEIFEYLSLWDLENLRTDQMLAVILI